MFKTFANNEILTAQDINNYLMTQSVIRVADESERDAIFPLPGQRPPGMVVYRANAPGGGALEMSTSEGGWRWIAGGGVYTDLSMPSGTTVSDRAVHIKVGPFNQVSIGQMQRASAAWPSNVSWTLPVVVPRAITGVAWMSDGTPAVARVAGGSNNLLLYSMGKPQNIQAALSLFWMDF